MNWTGKIRNVACFTAV